MSLATKPHTSLAPIPHSAWFSIGAHLWATDGAVLVRSDCPQHPDPQQGGSDAPFRYEQPRAWQDAAGLLAQCQLAATQGHADAHGSLAFVSRFGPLLQWAQEDRTVTPVLCSLSAPGDPPVYRVVITGPTGIVAVVAPALDLDVPGAVHWTGRRLELVWAERVPKKEESP